MATPLLQGGDKLYTRMQELEKRIGKGEPEVRVGFLQTATYPNGQSVAEVAAWQEFGTKSIPARPFFREMIRTKSASWGDTAAGLLKGHNYDVVKVLGLMGMGIRSQLQASIVAVLAPPLSAVTLMLRKMRAEDPHLNVTGATVAEAAGRVAAGESTSGVSTKPLVYSGHLLNSVDYEVTK